MDQPHGIDGLIGRMEELHRGGFRDTAWVERWDVAFADLYLDALEAAEAGRRPPEPWAVAFGAGEHDRFPRLRHVLLGMNAHINYDLAQSLLAVISEEEFDDPELLASRAADHEHIDSVLVNRVGAEDSERESRAKVWANARVLDAARRRGAGAPRRAGAPVGRPGRRPGRPGQVVLKPAVKGFGVRLPDAAP
jgi:Family of unknown function (DUF5995)